MQKNIYGLLLVGLIVASCGNAKKGRDAELNDKKVKLEALKKDKLKIDAEIARLQKEVALLDTGSASQATAKLVALAPVVNEKFTHFVDLQGRIDATNISYVAPPNGMGGVVTALYVRQGDFVRKGQTLARLDDQLIRQQMEPLRVQLATAEDTYRRTKNLFDQGIGTYQQVLNAKPRWKACRSSYRSFKSKPP
jgi:membrane fusion protein, multidrug efflux system